MLKQLSKKDHIFGLCWSLSALDQTEILPAIPAWRIGVLKGSKLTTCFAHGEILTMSEVKGPRGL